MKKDRWSGEKAVVGSGSGVPLRERPLVGVIPPLGKPIMTTTPLLDERRRFISEQVIRPTTEVDGSSCTKDTTGPLSAKAAIFENKIRAERTPVPFNVAEVSVTVRVPLRKSIASATPPTTPKSLRRALLPEPKKLLSQRIIFLNDHQYNMMSNNSKWRIRSVSVSASLFLISRCCCPNCSRVRIPFACPLL